MAGTVTTSRSVVLPIAIPHAFFQRELHLYSADLVKLGGV